MPRIGGAHATHILGLTVPGERMREHFPARLCTQNDKHILREFTFSRPYGSPGGELPPLHRPPPRYWPPPHIYLKNSHSAKQSRRAVVLHVTLVLLYLCSTCFLHDADCGFGRFKVRCHRLLTAHHSVDVRPVLLSLRAFLVNDLDILRRSSDNRPPGSCNVANLFEHGAGR